MTHPKMILRIWCLALLLLACGQIRAQQDPYAMVQRIAAYMQGRSWSYDYEVVLKLKASGKAVDRVQGHATMSGSRYIDSSNAYFVANDGKYFCRLDHRSKKAWVYELKALQRRLGNKDAGQSTALFSMPDSALLHNSQCSLDSTQPQYYRLSVVSGKARPVRTILELSRPDAKPLTCYTEAPDASDGPGLEYIRTCNTRHIKENSGQPRIDLSRIFTQQGDKILLDKKYSQYQLTQLTR